MRLVLSSSVWDQACINVEVGSARAQYFKTFNPDQNPSNRITSQNWVFQIGICDPDPTKFSYQILPRIQIRCQFWVFQRSKIEIRLGDKCDAKYQDFLDNTVRVASAWIQAWIQGGCSLYEQTLPRSPYLAQRLYIQCM